MSGTNIKSVSSTLTVALHLLLVHPTHCHVPIAAAYNMNGYQHINGEAQQNGEAGPSVTVPLGPTNQPRVLLRSLTRDEAVFNLSGVELGLANSVRRVMMADVPTVCKFLSLQTLQGEAENAGIDQVSFSQNTSPIPDEMLAHRLGMVPLISRNAGKGLRYTRVSRPDHDSLCAMTHVAGLRVRRRMLLLHDHSQAQSVVYARRTGEIHGCDE